MRAIIYRGTNSSAITVANATEIYCEAGQDLVITPAGAQSRLAHREIKHEVRTDATTDSLAYRDGGSLPAWMLGEDSGEDIQPSERAGLAQRGG